jgi:hypothetical protein
MLKAFPFTIFPLLAYNVLVFLLPDRVPDWSAEQFSIGLLSAETLTLTAGDLMILAGLLFLMFEMLRAASVRRGAIASHLASVIVLVVYVGELLVLPEAATATFATLTAIAVVDVLAGISISARVASRDVNIAEL